MIARLTRDRRGAAAVEFALLAPAFFAFLFLVIEGGRMIWTHQVLQEDAFATARCLGLKATGCTTVDAARSWATARAARSGVRLAAASVTPTASATCNGRSGMAKIVISRPYATMVGTILPAAPSSLNVSACFPNV